MIDLAVAVVIGAAFTAIVTALVENLFNPLIGAIFNADSLATSMQVGIPTASGGTATISIGAILAAIINFVLIAAVVYFVFVLPINKIQERKAAHGAQDEEASEPTDTELLTEIRDLLAAGRHKA